MTRKWKRDQKYHDRPRTLYALLFNNGACYIGQSIDAQARLTQHHSPRGGWCGANFKMIVLGTVNGTQLEGEDYEYAWRYKAFKAGWVVYGKPPNVVINPTRRMNLKRRAVALTLRWPTTHSHRTPLWPWALGTLALTAVAYLFR